MGKTYKSKWYKFKVLKKSARLAGTLPETLPFSKKNLWGMVNKYGKIILKPQNGSGGSGVMQLSKMTDSQYRIHIDKARKTIAGKQATYRYLKKKCKSHSYMVQRKISLAKIKERPFDLRVMVQRRKHSPWTITGRLAKVAGKGYIITNTARSRGYVLPVEKAILKSNIRTQPTPALIHKIDKIALKAAKQLRKTYGWLRITGLDMGIDKHGKLWIIEANFAPATSLFLKLKDKSMYRKIMSFQKK